MNRKSCWLGAAALLGATAGALGQTTAKTSPSGPEVVATTAKRAVAMPSLGREGKATGGGVTAGTCDVVCPPGGVQEGEANCGLPEDTFNGGCNSLPPVFSPIACGQTVCGTSAFNGTTRDTDWYRITLGSQTQVRFEAEAEFDLLIGIVENNGIDDCAGVSAFRVFATAGPCVGASVQSCLPPGTWWFFVGPQFTTVQACGVQYVATLSCQPCPVLPNDNCDGAITVAVPSQTLGSNLGAQPDDISDQCGTSVDGGGTWYRLVGNGQTLTATTCNAVTNFDSKLTVFCGACPPEEVCVTGNDDSCTGFSVLNSTVSWCSEAGAPYWIFVHGFAAAQGTFRLDIRTNGIPCEAPECAPPPPCVVDCVDNEGEPNCGLPEDVVNGGCNSIPPVFTEIECGDVICGTGAFDGGTRDTDWFRLRLSTPTEVTWRGIAEFDLLIGIVENNGIDDCAGVTAFRVFATAAPCVEGQVVSCLPAGVWYLFVAPQFTSVQPCGVRYQAELTCAACPGACDVDCPKGAIIEPEPCGQDTNGGCNSVPPVFTNIRAGDIYCGTAWADANVRDTDWYRLVLTSESEVQWCVATQFDGLIGIVENNGVDDCTGVSAFRQFAFTDNNCIEVCITTTLPAGTWWFFVATSAFAGTPCNSDANNYVERLNVRGDDPCNFKGCYADFDGNGTVNSADVGAYLTAYFQCLQNQPPADECVDCDRNGVCNSADVGCFLTVYFQQLGPCAP